MSTPTPDSLEQARLLIDVSDNISETESDLDLGGYSGSHQRAFSLLMEAMSALIVRLWVATLTVSVVMYFLRRIPVHPLVHHSGLLMSDREVDLAISSNISLTGTPALFGNIMGEPFSGNFET